jgi:hypothetical protein
MYKNPLYTKFLRFQTEKTQTDRFDSSVVPRSEKTKPEPEPHSHQTDRSGLNSKSFRSVLSDLFKEQSSDDCSQQINHFTQQKNHKRTKSPQKHDNRQQIRQRRVSRNFSFRNVLEKFS